ncbi:uncharacterized protein LOC131670977 [Phymastichus coffea]|uniref:uncharacterized protein LOC131670977 n=1 Tax=Phymastichus coffea TaxID=108790 RepID=UPI00273CC8FA|nr:uncharacterized protein LOC131670977 [Phymastichus coffea]XP_058803042.1 uncharacterized protein LOC131670977 [Phymastichus coffea]
MKTISPLAGYAALCLLQLNGLALVKAAGGSVGRSVNSKNAIATVLKVKPQIDNDWIVAVKDPTSLTGYAVKVKEFLTDRFFDNYFVVFMYARSSPKDKPEQFFAARICELLDPRNTRFPRENYMPRQVIDIILPGRYGSCDIKNTTKPINAGGIVNTDPDTNKEVTFPKSSPFELLVNILSMKQIDHPDSQYFFQVVFSVGGNFQVSGNLGSGSIGAGFKAG